MNRNKPLLMTIILILILTTTVSAASVSPPKLFVNGSSVDADTKLINNQVYVRLDSLVNAIGASAKTNTQSNSVNVTLNDMDTLVPQIIDSVSPSVVGIIGTFTNQVNSGGYTINDQQIGHGTGVVIKASGEIITNAHVVKDMSKIIVVLTDGNAYEATVKAMDEEFDLAVIKINKTGLKPLVLADTNNLSIGSTAIAIGTPISFSLRNSASIGIISGVNRGVFSDYKFIQTDAAINPGNSGGPLVNLKGEVIGINTWKYSDVGVEGMGFSIPANTVKYVISQFDKNGKVIRPYLGVIFKEDWITEIGLPTNNGITIERVEPATPASEQGLKAKDILLSINDIKVNSIVDYNEEMMKYEPNSKVRFKIKRSGVIQTINITFGEKK